MLGIVTAQQKPQPQQQNNHNCSWVVGLRLSNRWEHPPPTTHHRNSKLHDRAEIEQNSEIKIC